MSSLTYFTNIPNPSSSPVIDVPNMQTNTNSINTFLNRDHHTFNDPNAGTHKQTRMPVQASIPTGLIVGEGTLYTKTTTEGTLFYTPDASGNEYQISTTISGKFSLFGTNTNFSGSNTGGWTFLPGGLLLQYGTFPNSSSSTFAITFPVPFPSGNNPFSITVTGTRAASDPGSSNSWVATSGLSASGFTIYNQGSHNFAWYWMAIGK